MAIEHTHIRTLIDKLQALPPERIAEVEDFIDFLKDRDYELQLTHAAAKAGEPSLKRVWDNPEDAVYDTL